MRDHNEVFTRVLKQRDAYIRNQEANKSSAAAAETKPRVRFTRRGAVLAAACLVAVVGAALRFAPGILKMNLPVETEGPGEELNQIAETNTENGETSGQPAETHPIMIRLNFPEGSASVNAIPWEDPHLFPAQNEEGKDLVLLYYPPRSEAYSEIEKQYGYDPDMYINYFRRGELFSFLLGKENTTFDELTEEEKSYVRSKMSENNKLVQSFERSLWEEFVLQIKQNYFENENDVIIVYPMSYIVAYSDQNTVEQMKTDNKNKKIYSMFWYEPEFQNFGFEVCAGDNS